MGTDWISDKETVTDVLQQALSVCLQYITKVDGDPGVTCSFHMQVYNYTVIVCKLV